MSQVSTIKEKTMTDTSTIAIAADTVAVALPVSNEVYTVALEALKKSSDKFVNAVPTWARLTLTNLLCVAPDGSHPFTTDSAIAAACKVFKPMTAKGKLGATKGSLKDAGHAGISDRLTSLEYVMKNIGVAGVRPIVDAFIAADKGTFEAFKGAIKQAVKDAAPVADTAKDAEPEAILQVPVEAPSMADILANFATYIGCMNPAEVAEHMKELGAIVEAVSAQCAATAEPIAEAA